MSLSKVTLDGVEYNVVPSPGAGCHLYRGNNIYGSCEFVNATDAFCTAALCRRPPVIFLTDANLAKLVTARLTK